MEIIYILLTFLSLYILLDVIWIRPRAMRSESIEIIKELKNLKPVKNNYKGVGIVINIDSDSFENAVFTIVSLKKIGNTLPIWASVDSITDEQKIILKKMNVVISKHYSVPESILISPYKEILVISPGVIFFKDPVELFNRSDYQQTGALFWCYEGLAANSFVKKIIPYMIPDNPVIMNSSISDTNLMVINKEYHLKGLSILNHMKEYEAVEINEIYWISFELASEPYIFYDDYVNYNGLKIYSELWSRVDNPDMLNENTESPLEYFRKSFSENPSELLNNTQKNLLNIYRKIYHDLNV
jgi:hypothetical protein